MSFYVALSGLFGVLGILTGSLRSRLNYVGPPGLSGMRLGRIALTLSQRTRGRIGWDCVELVPYESKGLVIRD